MIEPTTLNAKPRNPLFLFHKLDLMTPGCSDTDVISLFLTFFARPLARWMLVVVVVISLLLLLVVVVVVVVVVVAVVVVVVMIRVLIEEE